MRLLWGIHFFLLGLVYISWSLIYYGAKLYRVGNGCDCSGVTTISCIDSVGEENDVCYFLYHALDWRIHPRGAAVLSALVLCVAVPLIALASWTLLRLIHPPGVGASCCTSLRGELQLSSVYGQPDGSWLEHFGRSPLLKSPNAYLAARFFLLTCMFTICLWFTIDYGEGLHLWLTHWTLYVQLAYCALAAFSTLQAQRRLQQTDTQPMTTAANETPPPHAHKYAPQP